MIRAAVYYLLALSGIFTFILFAGLDGGVVVAEAGEGDGASQGAPSGKTAALTPEVVRLETPQRVRPPRLKAQYSFAGEDVPVSDFDVRERLDRELITNTFYHSSTQWLLKHKSRYFPIIERILAEEGVPEDLKYIAVAESAFKDFRSPAGAAGVWHFMPGTARDYGLEVSSTVDERHHLEKATRAAAKFMRQLHQQMGSWTLAAAAYNRGAGGVRSQQTVQRGETYYDLNLNEETSRYVFRIIALKDILEDPTYYGFFLDADDMQDVGYAYTVVTVTESVPNLGDFALRYGTSYRKLKVLNPWLIDDKLTVGSGKSYEVRIPL